VTGSLRFEGGLSLTVEIANLLPEDFTSLKEGLSWTRKDQEEPAAEFPYTDALPPRVLSLRTSVVHSQMKVCVYFALSLFLNSLRFALFGRFLGQLLYGVTRNKCWGFLQFLFWKI
jgi:hypothetical protein